MKQVVLENTTVDHEPLRAVFCPEAGMNLISYKKGSIEVMDPHSRKEFEERGAGLGCLIGPHFFLQRKEWIVQVPDPTLFPHLKFLKPGEKDPFPHGIGRYVPWRYTATDRTISASLSGSDHWKGFPLSVLEGVDFSMHYEAELTREGLDISMRVSAPRASVIGLHYYYALPPGHATVTSQVQDQYNDMGQFKPMGPELCQAWCQEGSHQLSFDLNNFADYGFLPLAKDFSGEVQLHTATHGLRIRYQGANDQVSWQLYHPKGASFVCIEPISAKNPRGLSASSSSIKVQIMII